MGKLKQKLNKALLNDVKSIETMMIGYALKGDFNKVVELYLRKLELENLK
jgi:hypothetical protein